MKAIVICGPWGSGTTAVARVLVGLGCVDLQPHFITNDPKTGASYESIAFRQVVLNLADENTVSLKEDNPRLAMEQLIKFRETLKKACDASNLQINRAPIVLKYALSCVLIEPLSEVFDARFVFVERSVDEIESGRIRRGWPPIYGKEGAVRIYDIMLSCARSLELEIHKIKYSELLEHPYREAKKLARFCDLYCSKATIDTALAPIRSHQNYATLTGGV
jgi:hypothetical protein